MNGDTRHGLAALAVAAMCGIAGASVAEHQWTWFGFGLLLAAIGVFLIARDLLGSRRT
jgi:hypothetical protein